MKDHLMKIFERCLEDGSETDLRALSYALEGLHQTIMKKNGPYIGGLLHMEPKMDERACEITIPLNPLLNNHLNMLHGGITATVLDTAMGVLANHLVPEQYGAVTSQLNIHYLAPVTGEHLRCRGEMIHQGKKIMVISGEAFNEQGQKVAYATGSFFVIHKQKGKSE